MKKETLRVKTVQARVTEETKKAYDLYCKSIETSVSDHLRDYVLKVLSDNPDKSNTKD